MTKHLTLRELARHILALPDEVQQLPVYSDDRYSLLPLVSPVTITYRGQDGYRTDPDHDSSAAYLETLTKVAVIE